MNLCMMSYLQHHNFNFHYYENLKSQPKLKVFWKMLWSVYNLMYKTVQFIIHITTKPRADYVAICKETFMLKIQSWKPKKPANLEDSTIF